MYNKIKYIFLFLIILSLFIGCQKTEVNIQNTTTYLTSLSVSTGTLSPVFSTSEISYTVTVNNNISNITVTADGGGTIKINNETINPGISSAPIPISIGSNTITIDVYKSTSKKTYTINVIRGNSGNIFYVSPNGSNSTGNGSQSKPWATPGFGSRQLNAGDTLIILGGNYILTKYDDDIIIPQNSGTENSPIIIRGEYGNRPVLLGENTSASASNGGLLCAINLENKNYIRIENLEIMRNPNASGSSSYFRNGIIINGSRSNHIVIKDLYIHHLDENALNIQDVDDIKVLNCRFEYCGFGAIAGPAGNQGGVTNMQVKDCVLSYSGHYYQGGNGSNRPYDRPDGLGLEESDGPIEIANTTAEHNYGDGLDVKIANAYLHECTVANNSCDGIKLWQGNSKVENCLIYGTGDGTGGSSPWSSLTIGCPYPNNDFEIINNTIHDNPTREAYILYCQYNNSNPIHITFKNNIVSNGFGVAYFGPSVSLICINNIFYRPNNISQVEANGTTYTTSNLSQLGDGNISLDPKFINPDWGAIGNYHLEATSPAINAGTNVGAPSKDLSGVSRPKGSIVDIGAYEDY